MEQIRKTNSENSNFKSTQECHPKWRARALTAMFVGASAACLSRAAQLYVSPAPGGDFLWAMRAGADLLKGQSPYRQAPGSYWFPYPLPAAFVGLPFSFFEPTTGTALFYGVSAGLLTYGLTRDGYTRLLIFLAFPFWFALIWGQWSPLIMAAAFIPDLLFTVLIKPQIALPVALTYPSYRGLYACLAVGVVSLIVYPRWPLAWLSQMSQYQRFFPVATPLGPILLLTLLRWRDRDARLLLLASLFPQRHFYDAFVLWLVPKTWKEILPTALFSWGAFIWKMYHPHLTPPEVGLVSIVFFFLPALCVIFTRPRSRLSANDPPQDPARNNGPQSRPCVYPK
jgi:hypothetical protein